MPVQCRALKGLANMPLIILRLVFLMVAIALGFRFASSDLVTATNMWLPILSFAGVLLVAGGVLAADISIRRKRLDIITAVYFGLIIGLFLTYVLQVALTPLLPGSDSWLSNWLQLALASVVCYSCISVLLQTKDDFRFIIPYVEFAKEVKGLKPLVLDTSVVIDGRIADVVETPDPRQPADHAAVCDRRTASHRRFERQAEPQPRPPRARYSQPPAQQPRSRAA